MSWQAFSVNTVLTLAPAAVSLLAKSTALYAEIPPLTPTKICSPARFDFFFGIALQLFFASFIGYIRSHINGDFVLEYLLYNDFHIGFALSILNQGPRAVH
jgi:hypothetical protein